MRPGLICVVAALSLATGVVGCGSDDKESDGSAAQSSAKSDKPIVIGQVKGFTGFMESYDEPPAMAAELAVEDINKEGGVHGRQLEIVKTDNQTKVDRGRRAALEAIEKGAEYIQATCDFDLGAPIAAEAEKHGIVAASDCAGSVQFGPAGIGPLAFTFGNSGLTEGVAIAECGAQEAAGRGRSASRTDASSTTRRWSQATSRASKRPERKIVGEDTYKSTDPSIAPSISAHQEQRCGRDPAHRAARGRRRSDQADPLGGHRPADPDEQHVRRRGLEEGRAGASPTSTSPTYASIYGDDPNDFVNELVKRLRPKSSGRGPRTPNIITGYAVVEAFKVAAEQVQLHRRRRASPRRFEKFDNEPLVGGRPDDHVHGGAPHHAGPSAGDHGDPGRQDELRGELGGRRAA